jgi:LacI family transcriptional regulator
MAGVAPNTASVILNRRPYSWASKATEERVFAAAKALGYRPSRAARGIRLGKFNAAALVVEDYHNPFYMTIADHLEAFLRSRNYEMILEHTRVEPGNAPRSFEAALDRQIDGLIRFVGDVGEHRRFSELAAKNGVRLLGMMVEPEEPIDFDAVTINFTVGMREAIDHLHGLGHRKFLFLRALADALPGGGRGSLFRLLLAHKGIPETDIHSIKSGPDMVSAREAVRAALAAMSPQQRPTAIVAINDLSAIGAIRGALDLGLRVPEDLSVIGVDDIPLGQFLNAPLTTIRQPLREMAEAAGEILLARIEGSAAEGEPPPQVRSFSTSLVVRGSTAPPPGGHSA